LTVKTRTLLVPPLEQPTLLVLPAGVCTAMLKDPGAETIEAAIVTVSWVLLVTVEVRAVPLNTASDEETNWLPVAVTTKPGATCEKAMVLGEIELRNGAGRALPHRGFSALQPDRNKRIPSSGARRQIPADKVMDVTIENY